MLIDGRALAQQILDDLKKRVETLQEKDIIPHLAIIKVGDDPATDSYVRQKEKMGKIVGAVVSVYTCPANITQQEVLNSIQFLQHKGDIHGLIVQLPLPAQIHEDLIITAIDDHKDVDGFKPNSDFVEPIAAAVIRILVEIYKLEQAETPLVIPSDQRKSRNLRPYTNKTIQSKNIASNSVEKDPSLLVGMTQQWLKSQKIVVLGKGKTGGRPIIHLLHKMGIDPIIVDSKTQNRDEILRSADILICAVGNKGTIVTEGMIKNDAIVIGIGMSLGSDGKLHGDYDVEEIKDKASYYTPIPGGVGPVNAAMLLVNVVEAAERQS